MNPPQDPSDRPLAMFRALLPLAALALSSALSSAPALAAPQDTAEAQDAAELLPGTWHLVQHTLVDKGWGNRPSHTVLAPKGWKVEGGAFYPPTQAYRCFASHEVTITSPSGATIEIGPDLSFVDRTITTMQGQQRLQTRTINDGYVVLHHPGSARAFGRLFKKELLPLERPNAKRIKVKEAVEIEGLTLQLRESLKPIRRQFEQQAMMMPGMTTEVDGSVIGLEFEYVEDGQTWSHVVVFAQTAMSFEAPSAFASWGDTNRDRTTNWSVNSGLTLRAPKGEIEDLVHVAAAIRASLRPDENWLMMQARHRAKILKISREMALDNMRTARNIARISAESNAEIMDMQSRGHAEREAIRDEGHRRTVNSIHEVHEYSVPGMDDPVALPSFYDRVFSNGQGEFLLTNDALYEPGTDGSLSGEWSAVRRVR